MTFHVVQFKRPCFGQLFCKIQWNEDGWANYKGNFRPFMANEAKITETCTRIVEVLSVKSDKIVKASIEQP